MTAEGVAALQKELPNCNIVFSGTRSPYVDSGEARPDAIPGAGKHTLEERRAAEDAGQTLWGCVAPIMLVVVFAVLLVIAIVLVRLGGGVQGALILLGVFVAVAVLIAVIVNWIWPEIFR